MAENRRGKDKRYYFNRLQMVLLAAGFSIASVVIFVLGMVVGKGIEERKIIKAEEPLIKIPVKPAEQSGGNAAASEAKEELTFYDTLTKSPAMPASEEEKSKAIKSQEKTGKNELKEGTRKLSDAPQQATRVGAQPSPDKPAEKPALKKTAERSKPVEKVASAKTADKAQEHALREPNGAPDNNKDAGKWTVQVNAFPDEKSAQSWVERLKNKGYNAYVTDSRSKGKTWYRVRVGRYNSREEAERIAEALKTKENFPKAFSTERRADG
jgi:cell division septation protein DedD